MAKFTRSDFLTNAASALSRKDFQGVEKNAKVALALGDVRAALYLCAYYHNEILEGLKNGPWGVPTKTFADFGIMCQVSEYYKIRGYNDFAPSYQKLFCNSKTPPLLISVIERVAIEYIAYLQNAQKRYPEGKMVDIKTAEHIANAMVQSVLQQSLDINSKGYQKYGSRSYVLEPVEMKMMGLPPPHDHHNPPEESYLLGQPSKGCLGKICAIL